MKVTYYNAELEGDDVMRITLLKNLKPGQFFKFEASDSAPVWVRDEYDKSDKKYIVHEFSNVGHERYLSGTTIVATDFYF